MVELETEQEMTRADVATYLREFADKLDERATGRAGTDQREGTGRSSAGTVRESDSGTDSTARESDTDTTEMGREDTAGESGERGRGDTGRQTKSKHGERITFMVGNESATINPPEAVQFQMAVDSDSTMLESGTRETVEFSLHWDTENVTDDDTLDIQ